MRATRSCSSAMRTRLFCWAMSGWHSSISARLESQSGSIRASVVGVTGMIRRLSAGGRPSRLRSCLSVVITSEVRVTRSSLNCSSRWAASATSATVPRPRINSACSRFRTSWAMLTARSAHQSWTWACARFQYCCSTERTSAITSALNRQMDASALSRATTIGARLASSPGACPRVFNAVGSNPPIGLPSLPKGITRTISLLSRAILMASGSVMGQFSCGSGSSIMRGFATFGICRGRVAAGGLRYSAAGSALHPSARSVGRA